MFQWIYLSPVFILGVLVGEFICICCFCLLLKLIFPKKQLFRVPFFNVAIKPTTGFSNDNGPFDQMSEYFLKIYKCASGNTPAHQPSNCNQHPHKHQNNNKRGIIYSNAGIDDNSSIWLNELIQTALFYYKTSNTMHSTIKNIVDKILLESLPPFLVRISYIDC